MTRDSFQKHENGRNQAILDFYEKVKENPYRDLSRILEDIIKKYQRSPFIASNEYTAGYFGELHFMNWMAKENNLKVNQGVLDNLTPIK